MACRWFYDNVLHKFCDFGSKVIAKSIKRPDIAVANPGHYLASGRNIRDSYHDSVANLVAEIELICDKKCYGWKEILAADDTKSILNASTNDEEAKSIEHQMALPLIEKMEESHIT
ncbi:hypothetical protein Ciccas_004291 [Cichlidogyrus casuarinus]|uniref:Uncharacterized protein n=1 Tax=Cichlidogyrus casuarinus TaxID=1844966 RepID=A0ABD2QCD4_9PLAT